MGVKGKRDGAPTPGRQTGPRGKLSAVPNPKPESKSEPAAKPTAPPAAATAPKPKEPRLPGMERGGIKALDEAGARLLDAKEQVAEAKKTYDLADEAAQAALKKAKRDYYRYGILEIWLDKGKAHAKVKTVKPKDETKK